MGHRLDALFRPSSVAVIFGASKRTLIGEALINNIRQGGFKGELLRIKDISEAPDSLDLALICEPDKKIIKKCTKKRVKALVAMVPEAASDLVSGWSSLVKDAGDETIMIGPDSIGVINYDSTIGMNASLASRQISAGNVALITQSGVLGRPLIEYGEKAGIRFSLYASIGDAKNLSLTEFLEYGEQDEQTKIILLHTAAITGAGNFAQTAARIGKIKPIVMLKSGRGIVLRSADLDSGTKIDYELNINDILDQCGVHRANNIDEFFSIAKALSNCPPPNGRRVAIIANNRGVASLAKSILNANDLEVVKENDFILPLIPSPDEFARTLNKAVRDDQIDILLASVISPTETSLKVDDLKTKPFSGKEKPILGVFDDGVEVAEIPSFRFPETAVCAITAIIRQKQFADAQSVESEDLAVTKEIAQSVIDGVMAENRKELTLPEAMMVLDAYDIDVPRYSYAKDLEEALTASHGLGYPVSMRLLSKELVHNSDIVTTFPNVKNADELTSDFLTLISRAQRHQLALDGVLIQESTVVDKTTDLLIFEDQEFGKLFLVNTGESGFTAIALTGFCSQNFSNDFPGDFGSSLREIASRLSELTNDFRLIKEVSLRGFAISGKSSASVITEAQIILR